ncbi:importin subunit beta-3-like isoform X3 [Nicotiana tomentosiformis]|uniref:importin subunit beta-3-like isoform X3 n=1 Tax=Nicotiana tomentosiformis TaxID=4098 RepID=UPI00388CAFEB
MRNDNEMVQRAALKALSGIANLSKEQFQTYYDFVMPYLKTIWANANDKSNHKLQVRAFECISLVAMAVGKEKFRDDLEQVTEVLKSFQKSQVRESDTIVYILQACNRICQCIGKDFLPYMSTVMPSLVECAQFEPNKTISTDKLYDSIHKAKFGNEMICIKRSDASGLLGRYAHNLKEEFYPWISQICGPLLNEDQVHSIIDEIKYVLMESSRRNGELTKRAKLEDFDAEEAELLTAVRELEDEVCGNVCFIRE